MQRKKVVLEQQYCLICLTGTIIITLPVCSDSSFVSSPIVIAIFLVFHDYLSQFARTSTNSLLDIPIKLANLVKDKSSMQRDKVQQAAQKDYALGGSQT